MVKLLKAIARVPWWLLYRLVRMERHDKTYDWFMERFKIRIRALYPQCPRLRLAILGAGGRGVFTGHMEIGTTLAAARKRAGLSAGQVAARSGVPRKTLGRLEKNDLRRVTLSQLCKVAQVVRCRVGFEPADDVLSPGSRSQQTSR